MTAVLVTGATGYVGGRLVPELLKAGLDVRVFVRSPERLTDVPWRGAVDVAAGDLRDPAATMRACRGMNAAYYLVHSMAAHGDFETTELATAGNLAVGAAAHDLDRIIYLSGLHPDSPDLSRHLHSRVAVGRLFLDRPVPATVLQAGIVIGSGSASFEMIRHLTELVPGEGMGPGARAGAGACGARVSAVCAAGAAWSRGVGANSVCGWWRGWPAPGRRGCRGRGGARRLS